MYKILHWVNDGVKCMCLVYLLCPICLWRLAVATFKALCEILTGAETRGKKTTYPAIDHHQMCTTLLMGYLYVDLGRTLKWNPKTEEFIGDDEANIRCFSPEPRNWQNA